MLITSLRFEPILDMKNENIYLSHKPKGSYENSTAGFRKHREELAKTWQGNTITQNNSLMPARFR